jgi:large subunit ribosomal protein L24
MAAVALEAAGSWKLETESREIMSRLATPIRKNDNVVVLTGKDRGKRGRVLKIVPDKNRLIVEGVNIIKRHTKPNPQRSIKGGLVEREAALHASNVQIVCPECGKPTRIGRKILGDGRKVRVCRKCEGVVDK